MDLAATEPVTPDNTRSCGLNFPSKAANANMGATGMGINVTIPARKLIEKIPTYSKYSKYE
jgi:hypothetical protein